MCNLASYMSGQSKLEEALFFFHCEGKASTLVCTYTHVYIETYTQWWRRRFTREHRSHISQTVCSEVNFYFHSPADRHRVLLACLHCACAAPPAPPSRSRQTDVGLCPVHPDASVGRTSGSSTSAHCYKHFQTRTLSVLVSLCTGNEPFMILAPVHRPHFGLHCPRASPGIPSTTQG